MGCNFSSEAAPPTVDVLQNPLGAPPPPPSTSSPRRRRGGGRRRSTTPRRHAPPAQAAVPATPAVAGLPVSAVPAAVAADAEWEGLWTDAMQHHAARSDSNSYNIEHQQRSSAAQQDPLRFHNTSSTATVAHHGAAGDPNDTSRDVFPRKWVRPAAGSHSSAAAPMASSSSVFLHPTTSSTTSTPLSLHPEAHRVRSATARD